MDQNFQILQQILMVIGMTVSFSIASIAYSGVRKTGSISLLRLAASFSFLGLGFLLEFVQYLPSISFLGTTAFVAGVLLETAGYFFLAFSHAVDVMFAKRLGYVIFLVPIIQLNPTQIADVTSVLSFYFVMYGMVETLYSYMKNRRPDTLLVSSGLALLAAGTFFQWLSVIYPLVNILSLIQIIIKEMGLVTLLVPVLNFVSGRLSKNGSV
jgi:hypothetical protein